MTGRAISTDLVSKNERLLDLGFQSQYTCYFKQKRKDGESEMGGRGKRI